MWPYKKMCLFIKGGTMKKLYRLILVDDETYVIHMAAQSYEWEKYGFELVEVFERPDDALEYTLKNHVDAVITDINMPIMDGNQMISKMKEKQPCLVFAVMSGYDEFEYAREALKLGAVDYLLKPVGFEQIEQVCGKMYEILNNFNITADKKDMGFQEYIQNVMMGALRKEKYEVEGKSVSDVPVAMINCRMKDLDHYLRNKWFYGRDQLQHAICNLMDFENYICVVLDSSERCEYINFVIFNLNRRRYFSKELSQIFCEVEKNAKELLGLEISFEITDIADDIFQLSKKGNKDRLIKEQVILVFDIFEEKGGRMACRAIDNIYEFYWNDDIRFIEFGIELFKKMGIKDIKYKKYSKDQLMKELKKLFTEKEDLNEEREQYNDKIIRVFKEYIANHYMEDVTLEEISDVVNMSPTYFSKFVKMHFGENYVDYLIRTRLDEACRMLRDKKYKVNEIYNQVGFNSIQHFYRSFKKRFGCTPHEYRQKNRKGGKE